MPLLLLPLLPLLSSVLLLGLLLPVLQPGGPQRG